MPSLVEGDPFIPQGHHQLLPDAVSLAFHFSAGQPRYSFLRKPFNSVHSSELKITRAWGQGEVNRQSTEDSQGSEMTPYDIKMMDTHYYKVVNPIEYTTLLQTD